MSVEQWRVVSYDEGYKRIYTKEAPARRKYGEFVKFIKEGEYENEEEEKCGKARLFYRKDINSKWICIEEMQFNFDDDVDED